MSTTAPPTTQTYYDRFSENYEAERHHGYHRMIDELELQLIRQYGRSQSDLYPVGPYWSGGGPHGADVTAPIPMTEYANPLYKGCASRGA